MSTRILYSLIAVVVVLLIAVGAYWGYLTFYKTASTPKKTSTKQTQTTPAPPQYPLTETVGLNDLPKDWEIIRCGDIVWFANPRALEVTCEKALKEDGAAVSLVSGSASLMTSEKNQGATVSKESFQVGEKTATELKRGSQTTAAIKLSEGSYFYVILKKPEYEAQYREILGNLVFSERLTP